MERIIEEIWGTFALLFVVGLCAVPFIAVGYGIWLWFTG